MLDTKKLWEDLVKENSKPTLYDDRVLIKPIEADKITKGGIYIPDSATEFERKKTGIVICHGKGYVDQQTGELFPISVWEDCKVSFPAHLGEEFQGRDIGLEGGIYLLINERDIDVILEETWEQTQQVSLRNKFHVSEIKAYQL